MINKKNCAISKNIIFHEFAIVKTNLQDQHSHMKSDNFQFLVESNPGHNSQDELDETNDQEEEDTNQINYPLVRDPELIEETLCDRATNYPFVGDPKLTEETLSDRATGQQHHSLIDQNERSQGTHEALDEGGEINSCQLARDRSRREI